MNGEKLTLAVDFDGVLHSYKSGWQGASVVADAPVEGAMAWLAQTVDHFDVAIYSSRSSQPGGIQAMQDWIQRQLLAWAAGEAGGIDANEAAPEAIVGSVMNRLRFPTEKPAAFLTIDDRAIRFDGTFEGLEPETLKMFRPWNKR
jgi:hypothetical protein